ncbi:MAG: putative inorganic carbon transporter subunit DabA, partial [Candidatus Dechloromonas phosphoritropha]
CEQFDGRVHTRLRLTAASADPQATPANPQAGFTDDEQALCVGNFLYMIGLAADFAPLVLVLGHGSGSRNNPHLSAYDCGACSGRHGGPNARVLAAMANRPEVRARLGERGLHIPLATWFVAAEHNTCDDGIEWYDLDLLPGARQADLDCLVGQLAEACRAHAVERCRRLASAPPRVSPWRASQHVVGRGHDISQARPELGHATNAAAFIGRREMSRGLFLDRRVFLISYDPIADDDGRIVEDILLAAGPVGAGISLEYYFSTVDNERFGCSSKVTHNIAGLFGVMEGADSDLVPACRGRWSRSMKRCACWWSSSRRQRCCRRSSRGSRRCRNSSATPGSFWPQRIRRPRQFRFIARAAAGCRGRAGRSCRGSSVPPTGSQGGTRRCRRR